RVCPFCSFISTSSSIDSTALVMNRHPVSLSTGNRSACASRCSILIVTTYVRRPVEEIGIAKRDVLGARHDMRADVVHHDVERNGLEVTLVHRDDRTMPAHMLAPA